MSIEAAKKVIRDKIEELEEKNAEAMKSQNWGNVSHFEGKLATLWEVMTALEQHDRISAQQAGMSGMKPPRTEDLKEAIGDALVLLDMYHMREAKDSIASIKPFGRERKSHHEIYSRLAILMAQL